MLVVGITALDQHRDPAARRARVRRLPDRKLVVISRRPGKRDRRRRSRPQGLIDGRTNGFLQGAGDLPKILDPISMQRHRGVDDDTTSELMSLTKRCTL